MELKKKVFEKYTTIEEDSIQSVGIQVKKYFEKAWIYAVLDFAVGFGIYKDGSFLLRLDSESDPLPLNWKYLRELRVFDKHGEVRLTQLKGRWVGRFRGDVHDTQKQKEELNEFFIDEKQKLWGKVKKCELINDLYWSLLASERGTRIWAPIKTEVQDEVAVGVRKFMRAPETDFQSLVYQTDIRMVDFELWNGNRAGRE